MGTLKSILTIFLLFCVFASCAPAGNTPAPEETLEEDIYPEPVKELLSNNQPYSLEFVSNGDGTCYVSKLYLNNQFKTAFDVIIPEKSPAGDTVTGIHLGNCLTAPQTTLPEYLTIERLKAFQTKVETDYPEEMEGEAGKWWINAYDILDISQASPEQREEIVAKYPLCEHFTFCRFLPKMTNERDTLLRIEMVDITPSLTRKCYKELIQEARKAGVSEELLAPYKALMEALPVYTNNSEQVRYLHIPLSVTSIHAESLSHLMLDIAHNGKRFTKGVVLPVLDVETTLAIENILHLDMDGRRVIIFSQGTSSVGYEDLENFAIYSPEKPQSGILAWHYVDGVPTLWK